MKNIKELGLEVIQIEDQVLLINSKSGISKGDLFIDKRSPNEIRRHVADSYENYFDDHWKHKLIASTRHLDGLPLLVIEGEVEELAFEVYRDYPNNPKDKIEWHYNHDKNAYGKRRAFVKGFNKAKEAYKFTEEDLEKAIMFGMHLEQEKSKQIEKEVSGFIKSLTKKELWIEVKDIGRTHYIKEDNNGFNDVTGINFHKYEWKPKIINHQIKAAWK